MLDGAEEKCEMMLSVGTKPQRAVVLWCCGAVVVEVCREEEETLERWTSASAETSHGVIMMSRRHGARSDCLLCLQCCNVLTQTSFLSTAVSDDGCSVCCCCHGAAKLAHCRVHN